MIPRQGLESCIGRIACDKRSQSNCFGRILEEASMNIIVTLIIGGIVGWLASIVMKTNAQMGILANIVVGIIGSFLGFWIAGLIGVAATNNVVRWIVAGDWT